MASPLAMIDDDLCWKLQSDQLIFGIEMIARGSGRSIYEAEKALT